MSLPSPVPPALNPPFAPGGSGPRLCTPATRATFPVLSNASTHTWLRSPSHTQVAGFILFATYQLYQAVRADALARHPLFSAVYNSGGAAGAGATGAAGGGGHEGPYFKFESVVVDSAGGGVGAAGAPPAQHQQH